MSSALKIRTAIAENRSLLAAVVNAAFAIETFIAGTRTDEQDLARLMHAGDFPIGENVSGGSGSECGNSRFAGISRHARCPSLAQKTVKTTTQNPLTRPTS